MAWKSTWSIQKAYSVIALGKSPDDPVDLPAVTAIMLKSGALPKSSNMDVSKAKGSKEAIGDAYSTSDLDLHVRFTESKDSIRKNPKYGTDGGILPGSSFNLTDSEDEKSEAEGCVQLDHNYHKDPVGSM